MLDRIERYALVVVGLVIAICFVAIPAYADTLQSPNYKFDESVVGGGGLIQSTSTNYQVSESIGEAAIGNSASSNYQVQASNKTTNDPALTFSVDNGDASFGSFSPSSTATATATFSVINYTSYGYVVQIFGGAPKNGSHTISDLPTASAPTTGVEQFGINLVANTVPTSLGANPDNGQFGFGAAATNYDTSNVYRFVSGDTIASAPKSSGKTIYTISYIVNVNSLTPGGQYTSDQVVICTGTY